MHEKRKYGSKIRYRVTDAMTNKQAKKLAVYLRESGFSCQVDTWQGKFAIWADSKSADSYSRSDYKKKPVDRVRTPRQPSGRVPIDKIKTPDVKKFYGRPFELSPLIFKTKAGAVKEKKRLLAIVGAYEVQVTKEPEGWRYWWRHLGGKYRMPAKYEEGTYGFMHKNEQYIIHSQHIDDVQAKKEIRRLSKLDFIVLRRKAKTGDIFLYIPVLGRGRPVSRAATSVTATVPKLVKKSERKTKRHPMPQTDDMLVNIEGTSKKFWAYKKSGVAKVRVFWGRIGAEKFSFQDIKFIDVGIHNASSNRQDFIEKKMHEKATKGYRQVRSYSDALYTAGF